MTTAIETIQIGSVAIECVRGPEGQPGVVVRTGCERLGLGYEGQRQKLADPVRSPWATTFTTQAVAQDGKNREVFCLHVESVPGWLATLDAGRVDEEHREKVIEFQRLAGRTLADWAYGRKPTAPAAALDLRDPAALQRLALELTGLVQEQSKALAEAAPKVAFVDRYVGAARGLLGLKQLGKQLHQPEGKFVAWLRTAGYLYRDGDGTLVPKAEYGPTGSHLFEVRTWTVNDVVRRQTMATAKAAPYFAARLPQAYPPARRLPAAHRPIQHALPGGQP